MESKIEVLSTVKIQHSPDLYKIVDSLNRTLKQKDLMFGLHLIKKIKIQRFLPFIVHKEVSAYEKVDYIYSSIYSSDFWFINKSVFHICGSC